MRLSAAGIFERKSREDKDLRPLGPANVSLGRSGFAAGRGERFVGAVPGAECCVAEVVLACDTFGFPADVAGVHSPCEKGITMSELRNRMIRELKLAGLSEATRKNYLRAVRQLAAYYMVAPDRLSQRQVEDYILYVRDDLGVAKGTFAPLLAGYNVFYINTLDSEWPLFTKKNFACHARRVCPTFVATRTAVA